MRAGTLRHRVTLQALTETVDPDTGYRDKLWADVAQLSADITPLSGREYIAAAASQSAVSTRITIRYWPGVTAAMRLKQGDVLYNIEAVLPDKGSGREYLTLMCSTGVNDG